MANIREVADRAGVSVATVSNVLNQTKKTRPETRERVLAAVRELGYVQNAAARQLAVGRGSILGIVISDIRNPFFPEIVTAFQDQAIEHNIDLVLMNTNYEVERTRSAILRLLALRVPGVAVLTSQIEKSVIKTLASHDIPAVYIELGRAGRRISNIVVNDEHGIDQAVEHLVALGHRRIGFLGGPDRMLTAARRRRAFLESSRRRGIETRVTEADLTVRGGYDACARLLESATPTALLTGNDLMAIGAAQYAHEHNIALPAELSIVGFDDIFFARCAYPALTTVAQDRRLIGETAFRALWEMITNETAAGAEYRIGTKLVVRDSTAPPRVNPD